MLLLALVAACAGSTVVVIIAVVATAVNCVRGFSTWVCVGRECCNVQVSYAAVCTAVHRQVYAKDQAKFHRDYGVVLKNAMTALRKRDKKK